MQVIVSVKNIILPHVLMISTLYLRCDAPNVVVTDDFSSQHNSKCYSLLTHLISDNDLMTTDLNKLDDCSDNGANMSWIDHCTMWGHKKTPKCFYHNIHKTRPI
jgi:hypothetical protein